MSERLKPETRVSIVSSLGLSVLAICRNNKEPKIKVIKPKEEVWLVKRKMKRMQRDGKK